VGAGVFPGGEAFLGPLQPQRHAQAGALTEQGTARNTWLERGGEWREGLVNRAGQKCGAGERRERSLSRMPQISALEGGRVVEAV